MRCGTMCLSLFGMPTYIGAFWVLSQGKGKKNNLKNPALNRFRGQPYIDAIAINCGASFLHL